MESVKHGFKQGDEVKDAAEPSEIEGPGGFGTPVQIADEIKTKEDTRKQEETDKSSPNPPLAEGEVRPDMSSLSNSNIPSHTAELSAPTSISAESTDPLATVTHAQGQSQQKKTVRPQQSMASLRGFRDYLGWSGSSAEGKEASSQKGEHKGSASNSGVDKQEEVRPENGEIHIHRISLLLIPCAATQTSEETLTPPQPTETTAPTPRGQATPWSSYFYSFVVPEPKQGQAQSSKTVSIAPESESNSAAAVPPAQPTNE